MSHRIVDKKQLGQDVFWVRIEAPLIAQARRPGQFIILSINNDYSERIPLTIAGADPASGTIELLETRPTPRPRGVKKPNPPATDRQSED